MKHFGVRGFPRLLFTTSFFSSFLPASYFVSFTTSSSPSPPLCAPLYPPSHQSLALASPSRTYGMMDRRASGASEARGHSPGAPRRRGSQGPAMQPRPRASVFGGRARTCTHTTQWKLLYPSQVNLGPALTSAAAFVSRRAARIFTDAVRSSVTNTFRRNRWVL